jgi:hypothetical protein
MREREVERERKRERDESESRAVYTCTNPRVGAYYCSRTFTVLYTAKAGQFALAGLLSRTVPLIHLWRPPGVVVVK